MAKAESFLVLEDSLAERLSSVWVRLAAPAIARIVRAVEDGDPAKADALIAEVDITKVLKGNKRYLDFISVSALLFGASRFKSAKETEVARSMKQLAVRQTAQKQIELMLEDANGTIQRVARGVLNRWLNQPKEEETAKVQKAPIVRDFSKAMEKAVRDTGRATIQMAAGLHTSRLGSYGFLVEADALGLTTYQVSEQLDNRTCPVCQTMHGKTFTVQEAFDRLDSQLRVDNPADLKHLAPWPKQDTGSVASLRGMSDAEIRQAGWDTPPYHPLCRGILVESGKAPPSVNVIPAARGATEFASRKVTKDQIGAEFTKVGGKDESVEAVWATVFGGLAPKSVKSWFDKALPGDMTDLELGAMRREGDRNIAKATVVAKGGGGRVDRTFTDVNGNLNVYHSYYEIPRHNTGKGHAKRFLAESMEQYRKMGVKSVSLNANIDVGGYAWARYGFTPTPYAWDNIKGDLRIRNQVMLDRGVITKPQFDVIENTIKSDDPHAIWELSDMRKGVPSDLGQAGQNTVGKYLLQGSSWDAELRLDDAAGMARFNAYVGRGK
jgi:hypothetical protein